MKKKYHFVYITTNLKNGRQYVGDHSTDNLNDGYLGSGRPYFQRALNKFGKENFQKEILEFFETKEEAFKAQEKYINEYNTLSPNGYNISPKGGHMFKGSMSESTKKKIGEANKISLKGLKQSNETIEKRTKKLKGRPSKLKGIKQSKESIKKRTASNTGKKRTEEQKQRMKLAQQNRKPLLKAQRSRMSESHKGLKHSNETKKKISEKNKRKKPWNIGISPSVETRLKISNSEKGKIISKETRIKMSIAAKGKPKSEEHKKKCRIANLGNVRPKIYCKYCKKEYADYMYNLYHGEKCKFKN
jgi:hypothetical protein